MSGAIAAVRTMPHTTPGHAKVHHLFCPSPHPRTIGQERARCGFIRDEPSAGWVARGEWNKPCFCLVCIEIVNQEGTKCADCRKGSKK